MYDADPMEQSPFDQMPSHRQKMEKMARLMHKKQEFVKEGEDMSTLMFIQHAKRDYTYTPRI